jgi:hypothetical protein
MFVKKSKKEKKEKKSKSDGKSELNNSPSLKDAYNIVIFDGDETHDWIKMFANKSLKNGKQFRIVQASWIEVEVTVYDDSGSNCLS